MKHINLVIFSLYPLRSHLAFFESLLASAWPQFTPEVRPVPCTILQKQLSISGMQFWVN